MIVDHDEETSKAEEYFETWEEELTDKKFLKGKVGEKQYKKPDNDVFKRESEKSVETFDKIIMQCDNMLDFETEIENMFFRWLEQQKNVKIKIENQGVISKLRLFFYELFFYVEKKPEVIRNRDMVDENLKLEFLKEYYSETIKSLNGRLDLIKDKIQNQISSHTVDKEEIIEYGDIFSKTDEILNKIDSAIENLNSSYSKVSEKKAEINKTLKKYLGKNGYIVQKEKEINRLKIAKKLSSRMEKNFQTTLEITKNVDVLTETIIPGIKQLMSYKIPELIDKVNFECDKERAFLNIKS